MKTTGFLIINVMFLALSLMFFSCSTSRMASVSCPELDVYKGKNAALHPVKKNRASASVFKVNKVKRTARRSVKSDTGVIIVSKVSAVKNIPNEPVPYKISNLSKTEYIQALTASVGNSGIPFAVTIPKVYTEVKKEEMYLPDQNVITQNPVCDSIRLKNGSLILGKVEEIGLTEIKYRKCNFLTGPFISILKSDVSLIRYTNGTQDYFTSNEAIPAQRYMPQGYYPQPSKTEGLGLAGFILSLTGLLIGGIPLGILAVIFGAISLSKIKKNPGKYKGKGFATAALIIGLVDIVGVIILISTVI